MCISLSHAQFDLNSLKSSNHPKIGLVLGGGGAKGAAEIGVLKALEEVGLEFDYIAGTSIGSIIGALYSCGYRAPQIEELFLSQSWLSLLTGMGYPKSKSDINHQGKISGIGLSTGDQLVDLFDSLTCQYDTLNFDSMPIPFRCVATDIHNQEAIVLKSGNLGMALRASMSIPGMFKPVELDGHTLIDGGMLNNLPVDVVREMGAEYVITVDLQQEKHTPREFSLKETFGIGGILDWLVSRPDWKQYDANVKASSLYINPNLSGYDIMDFTKNKIEKMIAIGYKAAKEKIGISK